MVIQFCSRTVLIPDRSGLGGDYATSRSRVKPTEIRLSLTDALAGRFMGGLLGLGKPSQSQSTHAH